MSISPQSDNSALHRFVDQLHLRSVNTRVEYRSILNEFQCFVAQRSPGGCMTRQIIERWLRERATVWPVHMVVLRARLVNRFLDWLVIGGSLPSNPLAELRQEYGQTATAPIVRALLEADPDSALEALRPPPRFVSFLGPQMREYIALMQTMGRRYINCETSFLRFDRFLQSRPDLVDQPVDVLVREWTGHRPTTMHAWECLNTGRTLARALRRKDPTIVMPALNPRLTRQLRQQYRCPYIFTEDDVRRLFDTALGLPSPKAPLRPLTAYTMLVLAYCTGLRLGEVTRLTVGDIDLIDQTLKIKDTKFFKSRCLPLAPSVTAALCDYLNARRQAGAPSYAGAGLFWHQQPTGQYSRAGVYKLLMHVIRRAGFKPEKGRVGPRCHDLRHSFVSNRMLAWYREGVNPQTRLPYLATYLGHKDIRSTLVYLTVTQELLQQASSRFHEVAAGRLQISTGVTP
jgi:integrase